MADTMRAVVLNEYGGEDCLTFVKDHPRPVPGDRQALIRVKTCALSNTDIRVRCGQYAGEELREPITTLPLVPGYEISGIIEEVGSKVKVGEFQVGDEVVTIVPIDSDGGCAEFCVQDVYMITTKPASLSHDEAAATLAAGLTAYTALHYQVKIIAGESILILGGASEFGHLAVQLASNLGVRVLTSVTSEEERHYLEDLNVKIARIVNVGEQHDQSLLEAVMEETGKAGVDAILDFTGVEQDANVIINCLAVLGRWSQSNPDLSLDPPNSKLLLLKSITVAYMFEQSWCLCPHQMGRFQHILNDLMSKVRQDEIRPKVHRVMTLERIKEAHRVLATNQVGKVVIRL